MCMPAIAAALPLALSVAKSIQEYNYMQQQRKMAKQVAKNEARELENQAIMKENQIHENNMRADRERRDIERKIKAKQGRNRLISAVNNIDGSSGSALDILLDTAAQGEEDMSLLRQDVNNSNNKLASEANRYRSFAKNRRDQSKDRRTFLDKAIEVADLLPSMPKKL